MIENISFILGMAHPGQLGFQPAYSPVMEGIVDLHHYICFFLVLILIFVSWTLGYTLFRYSMTSSYVTYKLLALKPSELVNKASSSFFLVPLLFNFNTLLPYKETKKFSHWTDLEIAWTILPSLVLLSIAVPSFVLLYSTDELTDDIAVTIKVIGHQWYWSYEYVDLTFETAVSSNFQEPKIWNFDSYLIPWEGALSPNYKSTRLLGVDNPLYLPIKTHIRFLISAADVLHSFAIPSLGIKTDAVPGRLNQTFTYITAPGIYFGQCSEICGVNHGFMPIQVVALPWEAWASLLEEKLTN